MPMSKQCETEKNDREKKNTWASFAMIYGEPLAGTQQNSGDTHAFLIVSARMSGVAGADAIVRRPGGFQRGAVLWTAYFIGMRTR